jgi:hypothetical protein
MRYLIASILTLLLLLGIWFSFFQYAEETTTRLKTTLEEEILPSVEAGGRTDALNKLQSFHNDWDKFRKPALYLLSSDTIMEIDYNLASAMELIKTNHPATAAGELGAMTRQLSFLCDNEKFTLQNIF